MLQFRTIYAIMSKQVIKGGYIMSKTLIKVNEKIKELRSGLHLSQEYVANYLGLSRTSYTQMENGNRKITADDIAKLSTLFGVSADLILHGKQINQPATIFARSFENLDETDQAEIMNLIRFKKQIKEQRNRE